MASYKAGLTLVRVYIILLAFISHQVSHGLQAKPRKHFSEVKRKWTEVSSGLSRKVAPNSFELMPYGGRLYCIIWGDTSEPSSNIGNLLRSYVYSTTDDGENWKECGSGISNSDGPLWKIFSKDSLLFVSTEEGELFQSTNSGCTWFKTKMNWPPSLGQYPFFTTFTIFHNSIYAGSGFGVVQSSDNALSWKDISNEEIYFGPPISSIAVTNRRIFIGTSYGDRWDEGEGIFLTDDQGKNWTRVKLGPCGWNVNKLKIVGNYIFALTNKGIFRSKDTGKIKWLGINNGIDHHYKKSHDDFLTGIATSGKQIFISTEKGGVFISSNFGSSWEEIDSGLPKNEIDNLAIKDNYLFAAIQGHGIWRMPIN